MALSPGASHPVVVVTPLKDAFERAAMVQVMTAAADWQLAHPSHWAPNQWHVAPFWSGLLSFAPLAGSSTERYQAAARSNSEKVAWAPAPRAFHADDIAICRSYFMLAALDNKLDYLRPSLARLDLMLSNPYDETLEFSRPMTEREWNWCDALFMAPPPLAMATQLTGDARYAELMERLWWKTSDYLYDKEEHLFYRDSRFFDQRGPNGQKIFWSRGNGWVIAGIAGVLEHLPEQAPQRARLILQFKEMAERIASLQGDDGYWRVSLLDAASLPEPETSGTGFFTYAMAWGINHGVLDRAKYEPHVRKGWAAMARAIQDNGMLGYVQAVGFSPGETSPEHTEIYGVGALLMAGVESYKLAAG
jgi:unsaturated rhamnogalacturonyl hydrolase